MVVVSSKAITREDSRDWVITKFRSIVNPFLQDTELLKWKITEFWAASFRGFANPVITIATTVNHITDETPVDEWGNVMNNLMNEFIAKSSAAKIMDMDDATALLRNNVNTNKGVIGRFSTRLGIMAWYITCGNWILCNADITAPKAKSRVSTPMEWKDVFDGGGPESDIKMYWFTDGAAVFAPPKLKKISPKNTTYIEKSRIIPELLLYTTTPVLNWKYLPTQFL
jgi:hypothetical protein